MPMMAVRRRWCRRSCKRASDSMGGRNGAGRSGGEVAAQRRVGVRRWWRAVSVWLAGTSFVVDLFWCIWLQRKKLDVIHVHGGSWLAGYAHWLGQRFRVPVFCKEASCPPLLGVNDPEERVVAKSKWMALSLCCRFIAITEAIFDGLRMLGIPAERMARIPNGVELPVVVADPEVAVDALYVGNLSQGAAWKGFDTLVRAWGKAVLEEPGMRLLIYGGGDPSPWRKLACDCGCGDSVAFEGATEDVWTAHRQAGVFVLPSRREGLSNALLEAMASGLPAIVSDIPGNRAAVRDGEEGVVVPLDDEDALAAAIVELRRSPEKRKRMGAAARRRVEEEFSMETVACRLETLFLSVRREDGFSALEH